MKLLKHLRGILLQHSVLLRRRFLCHAIWGDPLFATLEYAEFAERLVTGLIHGEEPHLIQVERANLLVAGELQTLGRTSRERGGLHPAKNHPVATVGRGRLRRAEIDRRKPKPKTQPPSLH